MTVRQIQPADAKALSAVYLLLGRLWSQQIDEKLYRELSTGSLAQAYRAIGGCELTHDSESDVSQVKVLASEYQTLFVHSEKNSGPYQSDWANDDRREEILTSMDHALRMIESEQNLASFAVSHDHLGVQLTFIGSLLVAYGESPDNPMTKQDLLEIGTHFFQNHLTWPFGFFNVTQQKKPSEFYQSLINITRDFLSSEKQSWLEVDTEK